MEALTKQSSENEIKRYFMAVLKLSEASEEFPVNLDEVWPLVYSAKEKAVRALTSDQQFIEDVDYQVSRKNGENPMGGRPTNEYKLSVSCMEFFIARKVRVVFEVYRKVFHKTEKLKTPTLSPAEFLLQQAQFMVEKERQIKALEGRVAEIEQRTTTDLKQSTVVAYVSRHKIKLDVKRYGAIGTKASNLCKKRGIETSKVNDVRWGQVKVYPDEILDEVFTNENKRKG